MATVDSA